jgi:rare lipoprotein A
MRRLTTAVAIVVCVLVASIPRVGAANTSLAQLKSQRATLITRIARLTDAMTRAEGRAEEARRRRFVADLAADDARQHVARHAVDTYVGGIAVSDVERLRRTVFADVAARTDRELFGRLLAATEDVASETDAAEQAVAEARRTLAELQTSQAQLEATIAERVAADAADVAARQANTSPPQPTLRPRYARTTASQRELMARFPFGLVQSIPTGLVATGQVVSGRASWYGPGFDGRPTASGAIFDQEGYTVASKTLPLGTILLIHAGDRSCLVLVNDRGPYVAGRVLDLSHGVAKALGTLDAGVASVTAEVLAVAS